MIFPRCAEKRDFEAIMALIHRAQERIRLLGIDQWQDGYPEPELIAHDIENKIGCVFEDDGKIAAYLVLLDTPEPVYDALDGTWLTSGAAYATIHRMAIDDGHRGSGVAADMLRKAVEMAKAENLASVRADTHRGNKAMRRVLEKNGFVDCGEVTYPVDAGDPIRVAYELVL